MQRLDELEAERAKRAAEMRARMDPAVLAFADAMRATFGDGVRLRPGADWPGGNWVTRGP